MSSSDQDKLEFQGIQFETELERDLFERLNKLSAWCRPFVEDTPISAETLWREFPSALVDAKLLLSQTRKRGGKAND